MKISIQTPTTVLAAIFACAALSACAGKQPKPTAQYENPDQVSQVSGIGIESQDIRAMTDQMARDMLAHPQIAKLQNPPYVIVDDGYFVNESSEPLNKRMITERLMIELNRAAAGRMFFVERQAEGMVQAERDRKREGETGMGSNAPVAKIAGADYRLTGSIMTQDAIDNATGRKTRYYQITFKMVDLESGLSVWTNLYEVRKSSQSSVLYR